MLMTDDGSSLLLHDEGLLKQDEKKHPTESRPLISIITVVYNGDKYLEQTIKSVLNQSYENIEYIIVDGGSSDNTLDIIKKYDNEIYHWISEKDDGIYDAWNKGLTFASGDWIGFLGADDIYHENAILDYVNLLLQNVELDYISSKVELVDNDLNIINTFGIAWSWNKFKHYMSVAHVGSLHNRNLYNKYGLYSTTYKIVGDYEMLLRPKAKLKYAFLNKITASMRNGGISNQMIHVAFLETLRIKYNTAKVSLIVCIYDYITSYIKFYIKKLIN
jgi:glycosyltransferase involved in cell wall biosynthesis